LGPFNQRLLGYEFGARDIIQSSFQFQSCGGFKIKLYR
jgi:hypothetical protein